MSIKSISTNKSKKAGAVEDRPELWVPPQIAEYYAVAEAQFGDEITPLHEPRWDEWFAGGYPDNPEGTRLYVYLTRALAAIRELPDIPGTVARPGFATLQGDRAGHPAELPGVVENLLGRYRLSEELKGEFHETVGAAAREILSDRDRSFTAFRTMKLVEIAYAEKAAYEEAERREQERSKQQDCPHCHKPNGGLATRTIEALDNAKWVTAYVAPRREIYSCKPCWEVAVELIKQRNAAESLDDGRTRAQTIAAWLDADTTA